MAIWKEIRKAINSTLGTKDFKPLDEIIRGQKTFIASDANIASFPEGWFKPKLNGVVRLKFTISGYSSHSGTGYVEIIDEDNNVIATSIRYSASSDTQPYEGFVDFGVSKNKQYKVVVYRSVSGLGGITVSDKFICAQVVDANYFEIVSEV